MANLEIQIVQGAGTFAGGGSDRILKNAAEAFEDLGEVLSEASSKFLAALSGRTPAEIELELGLNLEASGNWIVVASKASANVSVTLRWK